MLVINYCRTSVRHLAFCYYIRVAGPSPNSTLSLKARVDTKERDVQHRAKPGLHSKLGVRVLPEIMARGLKLEESPGPWVALLSSGPGFRSCVTS